MYPGPCALLLSRLSITFLLRFFDIQWNNPPSIQAHFAKNSFKSVTDRLFFFRFLTISSIAVMFGLLFFQFFLNEFSILFNFLFTKLRYFLSFWLFQQGLSPIFDLIGLLLLLFPFFGLNNLDFIFQGKTELFSKSKRKMTIFCCKARFNERGKQTTFIGRKRKVSSISIYLFCLIFNIEPRRICNYAFKKTISHLFVVFILILCTFNLFPTRHPPPPPSTILAFHLCKKACYCAK